MITKNGGYKIASQTKIDVTTSEGNYDINGQTVLLQNTGAAIIYIDNQTGVDNTKFEIPAATASGPWVFSEKVYFKGAGSTTLKILFTK